MHLCAGSPLLIRSTKQLGGVLATAQAATGPARAKASSAVILSYSSDGRLTPSPARAARRRRRQLSTRVEKSPMELETTRLAAHGLPPAVPLAVEEMGADDDWTQDRMADVLRPYHDDRRPVILRGAAGHSPACSRWTDLDYLKTTVGESTPCEIEVGSGSYGSDEGVVRSTVAFGDYVDYVRLCSEADADAEADDDVRPKGVEKVEVAYLAQNAIFDALLPDVGVPELCFDPSYNVGHGKLYHTMFWFGPSGNGRGCVSPLHYDPMDNLFLQYVGSKRVLLYPPSHPSSGDRLDEGGHDDEEGTDDWYYAGKGSSVGGRQYNTSAVDVERPDLTKFPRFAMAPPALEGVVGAGDVLFIPKRWWHHVRSLGVGYSTSVNAWFR